MLLPVIYRICSTVKTLHKFPIALHLLASATVASAQNFPTRPIRLVVPFVPGGNIDITARAIAPGLTALLGQNVVVDNRGGAGGLIGTDLVAKSVPDGHTLAIASSGTLTVAPAAYIKMPYDPMRDLSLILPVSYAPIVLVVSPAQPAKTVKEFIALAKTRAGKLIMGSGGAGTSNHFAGELFQMENGVKFIHVPYKGAFPALIDIMGGQIDMQFDQLSASSGFIRSGKLRGLVVAGEKRHPIVPDVPTYRESGLQNCEAGTLAALVGPANLPRDVLNKLNAAGNKTLETSATRERFTSVGADVLGGTPAQLEAIARKELAIWQRVAKAANIKLE